MNTTPTSAWSYSLRMILKAHTRYSCGSSPVTQHPRLSFLNDVLRPDLPVLLELVAERHPRLHQRAVGGGIVAHGAADDAGQPIAVEAEVQRGPARLRLVPPAPALAPDAKADVDLIRLWPVAEPAEAGVLACFLSKDRPAAEFAAGAGVVCGDGSPRLPDVRERLVPRVAQYLRIRVQPVDPPASSTENSRSSSRSVSVTATTPSPPDHPAVSPCRA
jgi:hypothetical protein